MAPLSTHNSDSLRQMLASVSFMFTLFALLCTLFIVVALWGLGHAEPAVRDSLQLDLGKAPIPVYATLLGLKFASGLALLVGIILWYSRGDRRLRTFRVLLFCDIVTTVALLAFARIDGHVGPEGYFRVLAFLTVCLIIVWAVAGMLSGLQRPPAPR